MHWLTYLLTDLGEQPRSPPVLYVDNKAMLALCREHRLEHRTKHIALRYYLARELQQRGQLRLAYVASEANTADIFTKELAPGDHQRFYTLLGGIRIDSGGMKNFTDNFTRQWSRDDGFTSGMAGTLNLTGAPNEFNMPMYQKTTRYYLFALENCYEMPVPAGHYLIRMFFNPGPPSERGDPTREFAVSTLSTQIAMITPRTPGEFREMMVTYPGPNAELDVCFVANPSALSAFVNALEILPIDPEAYVTDPNYILFNYVRLRTGKGMSFGDGVSLPDKDKGHRQWFNMSTAKLLNEPVTVSCEPTCTYLSVSPATAFVGADVAPHYFPSILYSSAITNPAGGKITFKVTIPDKGSRVLIVLHFAEIDPGREITFKVTIPDKGSRVLIVLHFAEIDPGEFLPLLISCHSSRALSLALPEGHVQSHSHGAGIPDKGARAAIVLHFTEILVFRYLATRPDPLN
ncbi:unnamed protein product [Closterium sp. NIES-54]